MKHFLQVYRLFNILSIDVAFGAVISTMFFAKIFDVVILPYGIISLGLTVWIIYTADHLLDAKKVNEPASTERHRFHQQHFKLLFVLLVIVTLIDIIQLFFIRKTVFMEGISLASLIVIYFLVQRYLKLLKEMIGALLYSAGVLLIPMAVNHSSLSTMQLLLITQFAITALINLLLFSWFDMRLDEQDKHTSFATTMGAKVTRSFLIVLLLIQVILLIVLFTMADPIIVLALAVMNALLLIIFANRNYFQVDDRYRLLGDAVFFVPLIYLLS